MNTHKALPVPPEEVRRIQAHTLKGWDLLKPPEGFLIKLEHDDVAVDEMASGWQVVWLWRGTPVSTYLAEVLGEVPAEALPFHRCILLRVVAGWLDEARVLNVRDRTHLLMVPCEAFL